MKRKLSPFGRHLLIELFGCESSVLNNVKKTEEILLTACKLSGATVIKSLFHEFNPHGITGVVVISESHISIHTWPEFGYAACDVFTCGTKIDPDIAVKHIGRAFQAKDLKVTSIERGVLHTPPPDT
jgi:S-adenosylmethionine decarboxylase